MCVGVQRGDPVPCGGPSVLLMALCAAERVSQGSAPELGTSLELGRADLCVAAGTAKVPSAVIQPVQTGASP